MTNSSLDSSPAQSGEELITAAEDRYDRAESADMVAPREIYLAGAMFGARWQSARQHADEPDALKVAGKRIAELEAQVGSLTDWKESASSIMQSWNEAWEAAGKPGQLGQLKAQAMQERIAELEAKLDSILARDEEVSDECEGWWIGGAWGDYGEVVVPLRILSYVIDGELDQKIVETDPGFAVTYAEQVARAEQAEAKLAKVRELCTERVNGYPDDPYDFVREFSIKVLAILDGDTDDE